MSIQKFSESHKNEKKSDGWRLDRIEGIRNEARIEKMGAYAAKGAAAVRVGREEVIMKKPLSSMLIEHWSWGLERLRNVIEFGSVMRGGFSERAWENLKCDLYK